MDTILKDSTVIVDIDLKDISLMRDTVLKVDTDLMVDINLMKDTGLMVDTDLRWGIIVEDITLTEDISLVVTILKVGIAVKNNQLKVTIEGTDLMEVSFAFIL